MATNFTAKHPPHPNERTRVSLGLRRGSPPRMARPPFALRPFRGSQDAKAGLRFSKDSPDCAFLRGGEPRRRPRGRGQLPTSSRAREGPDPFFFVNEGKEDLFQPERLSP